MLAIAQVIISNCENENNKIIEMIGHEAFQIVKNISQKFLMARLAVLRSSIILFATCLEHKRKGHSIVAMKDNNEKIVGFIKIP